MESANKPPPTSRLWIAALLVAALSVMLGWRWRDLQVEQYFRFSKLARENQIKLLPVEPPRGLIFDRNGLRLAGNRAIYSLKVGADFADEVLGKISALSGILPIPESSIKKLRGASESAVYKGEIVLRNKLSEREIIDFVNWQFLFPEIILDVKLGRHYPHQNAAGHVIGHVGRINRRDVERLKETGAADAYRGADFIGKTGVELINENRLRGVIGFQEANVDAHGRILSSRILTPPVRGRDIYLTLDWALQRLAEDLLAGERGAAVIMDANSGALLALASSPRFDINSFIFGISQKEWDALNLSADKPLIHRAIYGQYAPGSTIKPFLALSALENGWRDLEYEYISRGFFQLTPKHVYHDWKKGGHGRVDIIKSIVRSVNSFYYQLGHDVGIDAMHDALQLFGFGEKSGVDLDNEKAGVLPSSEWKKNAIGEEWYPGDTIAVAVGQGYMQVTPLQMARAMAMLANGGKLTRPYLFSDSAPPPSPFTDKNLSVVRGAMAKVTQPGGTAPAIGRDAAYTVAGKTGTAQVSRLRRDAAGERIKNKDLPKHLRDHAWFAGYAPAEDAQVAVAVVVENGGSGGRVAGAIVRQLLDAYFQPSPAEEGEEAEEAEETTEETQEQTEATEEEEAVEETQEQTAETTEQTTSGGGDG